MKKPKASKRMRQAYKVSEETHRWIAVQAAALGKTTGHVVDSLVRLVTTKLSQADVANVWRGRDE